MTGLRATCRCCEEENVLVDSEGLCVYCQPCPYCKGQGCPLDECWGSYEEEKEVDSLLQRAS
jgi:Ribonuclease G/E